VGPCVLVLNDTQQTDNCTLSTLALAYRGCALPLAWCRWSGQLHGAYWQQIGQLLDQAQRLLPPHIQPVLLADRGLASPALVTLVQQPGAPSVMTDGWVFLKHSVWAHVVAVWRVGYQEPWLLVSNLDLGLGLANLHAHRMQIE